MISESFFMERYIEHCLVWTIALFALVIVYFLITRVILKKHCSFATYILSTLLGIAAGVGLGAALDGVVFASFQGYSKHPISVPVNYAFMLVCFITFCICFYFYTKKRASLKSVGGTVSDVVYALLLVFPAQLNYLYFYSFCSLIYHFLEK